MRKPPILLISALLLNYGCATHQISGLSDTLVLSEPPEITFSEPVRAAAPEAEEIPVTEKEKLFSLNVRDTDIRDILLLLSKESGINIIADKDVSGKLSIDFSGLGLRSALYAVTKQLGCTFRMENGFIRVTRPMLETRSFRIDYISGKRASSSSINASMSTGRTTSTSSGGGSTINLNLSSGTGTSSGTSSSSGQGNVNITTSGTSDFWKELREGLEVIIFGETKGGSDSSGKSTAGKDGKSLVVNELAGIVQVTDLSGNMERIENFLNDIKASVSKQVMIQAHIIEISLNDGFKFGLDWNLLTGSGIGADSELFSFSQSLVPNPQTKVFQIDLSNKKIDALLDAMKEQGQVNVLSSPKISTMNNQRAVMKLTTNEVSWITTTVYDADGNIQQSYTNPQIDEVGLFLDVTPQINDSGIITMQVHPSISEKIDDAVSPAGDNSKPVINIRELDTMISVNNGQTIVIAGLITDKAVETLRKVPILGDIPVLGRLFQQISRDNRKSELVIFLTPYVLTGKSIEDIRNEHEKRLERSEIIPSGTGKDKSEI